MTGLDYLKFNVPLKELIPHGYEFQKLYANNYKTYRKRFKEGWTIWLWVLEHRLEIDDWFDSTGLMLDFIKENIHLAEQSPIYPEIKWLRIQLNRGKREVRYFDNDNYIRNVYGGKESAEKWYKENEGWSQITIDINSFQPILEEIEWLTDNSQKQ